MPYARRTQDGRSSCRTSELARNPDSPPGSLSIVVPVYQESAGIPALERALRAFEADESRVRRLQVVLVDDGSTDGSGELLRQSFGGWPNATVVAHAHNLGLGAALETGAAVADGDYVAWFDSDLTYPPELLGRLAAELDLGADVALASCYHPDGGVDGVPAWRLALSRAASAVYSRLTGGVLHTYTSMVRAYRRETLDACSSTREGFLAVTEVLLRALRAGKRCVEVPAVLARRRAGQSKMRIVGVALGHLGLVASLKLGKLNPPRPRV
ncbi:MAG: glycosyltransferase family 2 protein [Planctomycetes bacterium]|nr:glycosyltransferase family 2 protein [Planctomycetota bacterium]